MAQYALIKGPKGHEGFVEYDVAGAIDPIIFWIPAYPALHASRKGEPKVDARFAARSQLVMPKLFLVRQ